MQGTIDIDGLHEVKEWLKGCVLDTSVSTPLQHLLVAYRMQDGRWSSTIVEYVVMHLCPGLRKERVMGRTVVHGIAPRWTKETLRRAAG